MLAARPRHVAGTVLIRPASAADASALRTLAALDAKPLPTGEVLVAEVDGELWAALGLTGGSHVADPFRPSGELVALLRQRAAQLGRSTAPAPRRRLTLRAAAA